MRGTTNNEDDQHKAFNAHCTKNGQTEHTHGFFFSETDGKKSFSFARRCILLLLFS